MRGVVFDGAQCREGALRVFEKTGLADRCEFVTGDLFEDPLPSADAYVLKNVLRNRRPARLTIPRREKQSVNVPCVRGM